MSLNGNLNKSQFMEELQQKVEHINDVLEKFLPAEEGQQRIIFEAMNYSVRAGGKRSTGVERRPHMLCTVRLWAFLQVMHF